MTFPLLRQAALPCLVLSIAATAGCQLGTGHQQNLNAANDRWKSLRASLILPMAQRQFDTGDLDQAERSLVEAISIDSKNPHLFILAGRVAIERGQLERAYQRLQTAISLDPKLPEAHYYQGVVLQRWKRYEPALASYQEAYNLQADNPAFLLAISEMHVALDQSDAALAILSDKAQYFDQSASIRIGIGQLYFIRGDFAQAVVYYQQAALLEPDNLQILEQLALAQVAAGQTTAAAQNLEKLCSDPTLADRPDLNRALAKCYLALGHTADAKTVYQKLLRADPKDEQAWIGLGEIAWSVNDTAGALQAANRAMTLDPDRHEGFLLAGMVWHRRGNLDRALTMFDFAAERAPKSAIPMILRGITLEQANRADEAAKAYAEALRRNPSDEHAHKLLAQIASP